MEVIEVTIRKPLYGTFVYIRETIINKAIREHKLLRVTIPQGTMDLDPLHWKQTGKRLEQVFKFKGSPMILWGNEVPIINQ